MAVNACALQTSARNKNNLKNVIKALWTNWTLFGVNWRHFKWLQDYIQYRLSFNSKQPHSRSKGTLVQPHYLSWLFAQPLLKIFQFILNTFVCLQWRSPALCWVWSWRKVQVELASLWREERVRCMEIDHYSSTGSSKVNKVLTQLWGRCTVDQCLLGPVRWHLNDYYLPFYPKRPAQREEPMNPFAI